MFSSYEQSSLRSEISQFMSLLSEASRSVSLVKTETESRMHAARNAVSNLIREFEQQMRALQQKSSNHLGYSSFSSSGYAVNNAITAEDAQRLYDCSFVFLQALGAKVHA